MATILLDTVDFDHLDGGGAALSLALTAALQIAPENVDGISGARLVCGPSQPVEF